MKNKSEKQSYQYIREIDIKYKKKRIKNNFPLDEPITNPEKMVELFSDLQNETKEKLITISLDNKLKVLCFEVVAIGSSNTIAIRPIEAIRAAIPLNPLGIVLVHNHTSGDPTPSDEDKKFTARLLLATEALGIEFFDHIIIGDEGKFFSFREEGIFTEIKNTYKTLIDEL